MTALYIAAAFSTGVFIATLLHLGELDSLQKYADRLEQQNAYLTDQLETARRVRRHGSH